MIERSVGFFPIAAMLALILAILPDGTAIAAEFGRTNPTPAVKGADRDGAGVGSPASSASEAAEAATYAALFSGLIEWNRENVEKLRQALPALPEPAAARIIWLALSAPDSLDVSGIFSVALSPASPPGIRAQAAEAVIDLPSSEARTGLIRDLMAKGADGNLAMRVIDGMASKTFPKSVHLLMEAMELAGSAENRQAESDIAIRLRNLTRANIPAQAQAWLDWWKDNSGKF